jgi:hypothetical protein
LDFIWCDVGAYLYKKSTWLCIENVNIPQILLKLFLILMKFIISTKHCDSVCLDHVCKPFKEFDNYYITIKVVPGLWPLVHGKVKNW